MKRPADARSLALELRELWADEKAGVPLKDWYQKSLALEQRILGDPELANLVANIVWDWLSDADIRRKAPIVVADQEGELLRVLQGLEAGNWPE